MPPTEAAPEGADDRFPAGSWFSVVGNVRLGAGGQTRMVLLRHRLMLQAGLDLPILTFNPVASYDDVRRGLLADGLLLPQSRLINLHEDLRERAVEGTDPAPPIDAVGTSDDVEDGYAWRRRHVGPDGTEVAWEYLRRDGTPYAVTPADRIDGPTRVLDPAGRVVMSGDDLGALWRWWLRQVVPAEGPVFLVSDSRFVAEELGLLDDPRIVLMHQVHNPHLRGERRWDSPVEPSYAASLATIDRLDAVNTLTERQRRDLVLRYGPLEQLHVVANPVEPVEPPEPRPARVPGRIVVIARLHPQKQLDQAVEAFALLAREDDVATLEVYGDGDDEVALRALAAERGVADRVTFHGHDPHAADQLWSADLAWLTSRFEGYGLFLLEARVRECPVLSFDVPYGPAEQVRPGVDGVLVPPGDAAALARETLALLRDRDRLEAMRGPARAGALAHGHESFLDAWADVARSALARKPGRTHLERVTATVDGRRATVRVEGRGDLDAVDLRWQAWRSGDDAPTELATTVTRDGSTFSVEARPAAEGTQERLLLTWRNSTWQQRVEPRRSLLARVRRRLAR